MDAALFAIQSPLSKGVILADEVGLGKTIEASIVIAQRWAERKRRILLIVPATLRKQWQQDISGGGTAAGGDGWADAAGTFLAEVAAGPVYRLLGTHDLGTSTYPSVGTAVISGDLGFRQHSGGHTPLSNWLTFITFASRYLEAPVATDMPAQR